LKTTKHNSSKLTIIGTLLVLALAFHNEANAGVDLGFGSNNSFTEVALADTSLVLSQVLTSGFSNNTGAFEKLLNGNHAESSSFINTPTIDQSHDDASFSSEYSRYSESRTDSREFSNVSVVPEPKTYLFLLAGLGYLGFRNRQISSN
jgi:hypothetical protein